MAAPTSLLFGFHPAREALRQRPHEVLELWLSRRRQGPRARELQELAVRHQVTVLFVTERELDAHAGGPHERATHNGVAVLVRGTSPGAPAAPPGDAQLVVLLEDVQDPRNLGALLRVCEGAGVGRVLVRDRGTAPLGATAVKASAGASEWLRIERVTNAPNAILELKRDGFWVYGADAAGEPPWRFDLRGPVALCFGGEEKGLRRLTRERCDALVGLPMRGRVESLNVATAAAALLYEAVRQRTTTGAGDERRPGGPPGRSLEASDEPEQHGE